MLLILKNKMPEKKTFFNHEIRVGQIDGCPTCPQICVVLVPYFTHGSRTYYKVYSDSQGLLSLPSLPCL